MRISGYAISEDTLTSLATECFCPERGRRGVLRQIRQEVRRPNPGQVHHLGLEIRPVRIVQVSTALHLLSGLGGGQGPHAHQQPLGQLGTHHIHEAGGRTSLGERGKSGPFLGALRGRETLPSALVSLCMAIGHKILFPSSDLSGVILKPYDLFGCVWGPHFIFKMFGYFNIANVLRCNSHVRYFTHLKCTILFSITFLIRKMGITILPLADYC